ncbi:DUF4411 family protein [bacterium]|nr:DUF4411 family protein [bacterium]
MTELFAYYCFDTSALVTMWRFMYPPRNFASVWRKMETHINQGELVIPQEVYDELDAGNDDLFEFVKEHAGVMVKHLDDEQVELTFEILARFPGLVDVNRTIPEADPYVIALARQKGWNVVTSEVPSGSAAKPKIPNVCEAYRIPCLSPIQFINEMNWNI